MGRLLGWLESQQLTLSQGGSVPPWDSNPQICHFLVQLIINQLVVAGYAELPNSPVVRISLAKLGRMRAYTGATCDSSLLVQAAARRDKLVAAKDCGEAERELFRRAAP